MGKIPPRKLKLKRNNIKELVKKIIVWIISVYICLYLMVFVTNSKHFGFMMKIDSFTNNMFIYFSLLDFLIIYIVVIALMRAMSIKNNTLKVLCIFGIVFLFYFSTFPLLHILNFLVSLTVHNKPMNLSKDYYFPCHKTIENPETFKHIKYEVVEFLKKSNVKCFTIYYNVVIDPHDSDKTKCWKWYPILNLNGWSKHAVANLPFTTAILQSCPYIKSASLSILEPFSEITPHRGYMKGLLRYHLGIIVPDVPDADKPYIVCGGEKYIWKEGEGVIFDDMYIHYVKNNSQYRRVVLFVDILRKDIPSFLKSLYLAYTTSVTKNVITKYVLDRHDSNQHAYNSIL